MAGETIITVIGNLTADPELRYTPSGYAVASFTVASTERVFNKQTNDWGEGETLFLRCSLWREAAENVSNSLVKGTRVIVSGRLKVRSWETKDGVERASMELDVEEVGPSLRFATAAIQRRAPGTPNQPQGAHADTGWATNGQQPPF